MCLREFLTPTVCVIACCHNWYVSSEGKREWILNVNKYVALQRCECFMADLNSSETGREREKERILYERRDRGGSESGAVH